MKQQLNVALTPDGIVLGNCRHCVTKKQRPPLGTPKDYVDLGEEELLELAAQMRQKLAELGVQMDEITFVPKKDLPRVQS